MEHCSMCMNVVDVRVFFAVDRDGGESGAEYRSSHQNSQGQPNEGFGKSRIPPPLPLEKVPVNRYRLDTARIVRLWAVHQVTSPAPAQIIAPIVIVHGTPTA